jgi:membrane associated rhomboid family serine protease
VRGRLTATLAIAAVTIAAFLIISLSGATETASLQLGFIPLRLSLDVPGAWLPVWLTPLSATLVHAGGFLHLVMNLLLLVWCGREVERILGPGPVAVLYVAGAYLAATGQYALDPMSQVPMVGASGAISALVGAFALSFSQPRPIVRNFRLNRALNILWILVAWVILQWMTAYLMGMQGVMVATGAHVGGFLAGLVLQKPLLLWRYRKA